MNELFHMPWSLGCTAANLHIVELEDENAKLVADTCDHADAVKFWKQKASRAEEAHAACIHRAEMQEMRLVEALHRADRAEAALRLAYEAWLLVDPVPKPTYEEYLDGLQLLARHDAEVSP